MVAVLLRLRFRVLANTLRANPVQLVAAILGACVALLVLTVAAVGMFLAALAPPEATQVVVVIGGSTLLVGWLVGPLLFEGVDRTLDPVRLARFPLSTRQLMVATFLVGLTGVPGIVSVLGSVSIAAAWSTHPAAVTAAVGAGLVGAASCVVGSRLSTQLAGILVRGRGAARLAIAALCLLLIAASFSATPLPRGRRLLQNLDATVDVLGWTPVGAIWSVPGRLVLGDTTGALGAAAVGVGTLAALTLAWRLTLRTGEHGGSRPRVVAGGRLGPLEWMPSTPTGAVVARSLLYWFRDARLARQLVLVPVLPMLTLLAWKVFDVDLLAIAIGPLVASVLPLSVFAGLSYDGTAYAAGLSAGVRGLHDRAGRAIALLIIAAPATVIVQLVVAAITGLVDQLPALLGLSLGTLLVATGVVSVSSARIVVPMARSGRNPFSAQPGAATTWIVGSYLVTAVTGLVLLPVASVAVAALLTSDALLGWLALGAGVALGAGATVGGVVLGGRVLDTSGPTVLARLRTIRV